MLERGLLVDDDKTSSVNLKGNFWRVGNAATKKLERLIWRLCIRAPRHIDEIDEAAYIVHLLLGDGIMRTINPRVQPCPKYCTSPIFVPASLSPVI